MAQLESPSVPLLQEIRSNISSPASNKQGRIGITRTTVRIFTLIGARWYEGVYNPIQQQLNIAMVCEERWWSMIPMIRTNLSQWTASMLIALNLINVATLYLDMISMTVIIHTFLGVTGKFRQICRRIDRNYSCRLVPIPKYAWHNLVLICYAGTTSLPRFWEELRDLLYLMQLW